MRYLLSILVLLPIFGYSQLTTSSMSPGQLVQDVLLGPGVTVSNISFTGASTSIGRFSATGTNLGINEGVILTTGTIYDNGSGPQGPNDQANCGVNNNAGGYSRLSNLIGG